MRMMMRVSIPVEAGNRSIADGELPKVMASFVERHKPEASYFVADRGKRTAMFFFDLDSPSDIPLVAESFFMKLNADIEVTPAMNLADMKSGLDKANTRR